MKKGKLRANKPSCIAFDGFGSFIFKHYDFQQIVLALLTVILPSAAFDLILYIYANE